MNLHAEGVMTQPQMGSRHIFAIIKDKTVNGKNYIMNFQVIGDQLSALKVSLSKACM